jgi:hypothetical protein
MICAPLNLYFYLFSDPMTFPLDEINYSAQDWASIVANLRCLIDSLASFYKEVYFLFQSFHFLGSTIAF